jgi:hypothetical protein
MRINDQHHAFATPDLGKRRHLQQHILVRFEMLGLCLAEANKTVDAFQRLWIYRTWQ